MTIYGLSESLYPKKPAHFDLESIIRPNILALHPYRCARDDYSEGILLDANENSLGHSIHTNETAKRTELDAIEQLDLHRYPSPSHEPIKSRIANIRNLPGPEHVFLGVGSDEVIDLLIRIIVKPGGQEKILITPPTYGMYSVCAQINDVGVVKVPLQLEPAHGEGGEDGRFSLRVDKVQRFTHPGIDFSDTKTSLGQGSDRLRSLNQNHLPVFSRKPNGNDRLLDVYKADIRL